MSKPIIICCSFHLAQGNINYIFARFSLDALRSGWLPANIREVRASALLLDIGQQCPFLMSFYSAAAVNQCADKIARNGLLVS